MSIHGAGLDHRAYVLFAVLTHAAIGYTLVSIATDSAPLAGVAGAVVPDIDLLFAPGWPFPFVHRGLTHTPLFAVVVVGAVVAWERYGSEPTGRSPFEGHRIGAAVTLGYGSHLVVDSLTASGVPWLYPLSTAGYGVVASIHAVEHGLVIWSVLGTVLLLHRRLTTGNTVSSASRRRESNE